MQRKTCHWHRLGIAFWIMFFGLSIHHVTAVGPQDIRPNENTPTSNPAADALTRITPPCSVQPTADRDDPDFRLKVTNTSGKAISRLVVRIVQVHKDGRISDYSHTNDRFFGVDVGNELAHGKSFEITIDGDRVPDDVEKVLGIAKSARWSDGSEWPSWDEANPEREGDAPVSVSMVGVVHEGEVSAPIIAFFNHRDEGVERLEYQVYYLDDEGTEILKGTRMRLGGIGPKKAYSHVGEVGVPKNAARVRVVLNFATFDDGMTWRSNE